MTSPASDKFDIQIFDNCRSYLDFCFDFIAQDPYSTNVISVVATGITTGVRDQGPSDIFIAVCRDNNVVGMAMHTPPYELFISKMPASAAGTLAVTLFELQHELAGVNGEKEAIKSFAARWSKLTGAVSEILTATRLYRLDKLKPPIKVEGEVKPADASHTDLISQWLAQFHDEAAPDEPVDDFKKTASRRIKAGEMHLWIVGDTPVALAGRRPAICDLARIGPVYTPKLFRGRGFGSAITAAATKFALDHGATQVALYTDLSNPTSNSIYQKIGYYPDHDGLMMRFK